MMSACALHACPGPEPGPFQTPALGTVPGLQRTITRFALHAALRPGHAFLQHQFLAGLAPEQDGGPSAADLLKLVGDMLAATLMSASIRPNR
jgi:hypothetical protein